jgi:ribonucleoside-diphosphate reductase alpha chain
MDKKIDVAGLALQPASQDIWDKKYRLTDQRGHPVDADVAATYQRVAHALASVEASEDQSEQEQAFLWALEHGATPAGRIMANAGAEHYKPKTSTINCTVSGIVPDSMQGILQRALEAGMTLKSGCGCGYCFSTLRPKGAMVAGAGASTSGPLSFMDIFDRICNTVASAGGRRGAQMGTFDVQHPDVEAFIEAKREDGRLRQFNLSLLISHDFIRAVKDDERWPLVFPVLSGEKAFLDLSDPEQVVWREWENLEEGYTIGDGGMVACKVYKSIRARDLWDKIMHSTYDYAEPGFILIDSVNDTNNNWFCETIRATNPLQRGHAHGMENLL